MEGIGKQRERFRLQRFLDRLHIERESLGTKLVAIRAADPQQNLQRGFSLSYDEHGELVKSIGQLKIGMKLKVLVNDGSIGSTINELEADNDE